MRSRLKSPIAIAAVAAVVLAVVVAALLLRGDEDPFATPSSAAAGYMRAQLSKSPDACDYMTEEMQQSWISNVIAGFSPSEEPENCDEATAVFIDWSEKNGQMSFDAGQVKIETSEEQIEGEEATVLVRTEISRTNRSQTRVALQRVNGRWLVAGTDAP